jgi:hypothetical protein
LVVVTAGLWLFVLPFYKARCIICGLLRTELAPRVVEQARVTRAGATLLIMGALVVGIVLLGYLAAK